MSILNVSSHSMDYVHTCIHTRVILHDWGGGGGEGETGFRFHRLIELARDFIIGVLSFFQYFFRVQGNLPLFSYSLPRFPFSAKASSPAQLFFFLLFHFSSQTKYLLEVEAGDNAWDSEQSVRTSSSVDSLQKKKEKKNYLHMSLSLCTGQD